VQHDAVEDGAHAVLADAEVQRAAVLVAGESLGGELARHERGLALDRGVVALGQVRRAAPQLRQERRDRVEHLAGRGPGGEALRIGRELRQRAGPALGEVPATEPVQQAARSSSAPRQASNAWVHSARAARPRSTTSRACSSTSASTWNDRAGSRPSTSLVAATSSLPSAEPWILPVFCLFGAGQPMIVRSEMNDGRSVSAFAASNARHSASTSSV
jgi:hypothetical protein